MYIREDLNIYRKWSLILTHCRARTHKCQSEISGEKETTALLSRGLK